MAISVQTLEIPDVGVGPGPFPSTEWTAATFATLTRLGFGFGANGVDRIVLLGSATGTDPIDATNKNSLGGFIGNQGSKAPILSHATACAYYAILRYAPGEGEGTPTRGATFQMQGF